MIKDSQLNLSWPVIGAALKVRLENTEGLNLADPTTYVFKVSNSLPSSSTTNPKAFSERYITDEPITTQIIFLSTSALQAYLSLSCAAYGSVWRTATITTPSPTNVPKVAPTATSKDSPKDRVHFSYESNPGFFLQSGSIITNTSPGFSAPKGVVGGQKTVKLSREEAGWVHEMLVGVWMGMVADPNA